MTHSATRRTVLLATGATALTAGCGGGDGDGDDGDDGDRKSASPTATGGGELVRTDEIPVGGGKVLKDRKVVVTQPEKGDFKAFSAVCTHQGCTVAEVAGGTINCACHGSRFALADGAVRKGPATEPLPAERITVEDGSVRLT